jgi:hypothetical protein
VARLAFKSASLLALNFNVKEGLLTDSTTLSVPVVSLHSNRVNCGKPEIRTSPACSVRPERRVQLKSLPITFITSSTNRLEPESKNGYGKKDGACDGDELGILLGIDEGLELGLDEGLELGRELGARLGRELGAALSGLTSMRILQSMDQGKNNVRDPC